MKKSKRKIPTIRIKELAKELSSELEQKLPLTVLPDGGIVYKQYLVKQIKNGNWAMYNYKDRNLIEQFFLKTCALMAAKAYNNVQLDKFHEIKRLDTCYWAKHCDTQVFKHNIKLAKDFTRYLILLNKLEESELKETHYKEEISKMFKWSFV
jgi:hypothetical protein